MSRKSMKFLKQNAWVTLFEPGFAQPLICIEFNGNVNDNFALAVLSVFTVVFQWEGEKDLWLHCLCFANPRNIHSLCQVWIQQSERVFFSARSWRF